MKHLISFSLDGPLAICGASDTRLELVDSHDRVTCPACKKLLERGKAKA